MESKFWAVVNWGVLTIIILGAVWMIWGFPQDEEDVVDVGFGPSGDCVDVSEEDGFGYEACYDAYSEMIFLKVSRKNATYDVDEVSVSFVDLASQFYDLDDVPGAGEEKAYKILAKKNPRSIDVRLGLALGFSGLSCGGKSVFVDYCPVGTGGEGVDVSISPIEGVGISDFIEIEDVSDFDSDVIVMDLVEKESIWGSVCRSDWRCGKWEACEDDVQRRSCRDTNDCFVPIDSPVTVKNCDESCIENWECDWTGCEDGFSTPDCRDVNSCGTSFNAPKKLACEEEGKCSPNVVCSDWTGCDVDYDFVDLVGADQIMQLEGSKSRVCVDKRGCVATQKEEVICSIGVDIYTKRFERCGEGYVGIYDVLDDSTLAILKEGGREKLSLNIYFDDQDSVHCDYCFDGEMNGDEEEVDCGGSCRDCVVEIVIEKKSWWEYIF